MHYIEMLSTRRSLLIIVKSSGFADFPLGRGPYAPISAVEARQIMHFI